MSHFFIQAGADGQIEQIFRDNELHAESIRLEAPQSIVQIYYQLADRNLRDMSKSSNRNLRRSFGLQSFLMSLTGLEAFTNTVFHMRARELNNMAMVQRIAQSHGSLSMKIRDLIDLSGDGPLVEQEALIDRIFALSQLRNQIVHPRWEPSSMTFHDGGVPLIIHDLVQNFQAVFEDVQFCREANLQCLLVPARYSQALGHNDTSGFIYRWTAHYGLTLDQILAELDDTSPQP